MDKAWNELNPGEKTVRIERLEMAGYQAASNGYAKYESNKWNAEEKAAYDRGFKSV